MSTQHAPRPWAAAVVENEQGRLRCFHGLMPLADTAANGPCGGRAA